MKKLSLVLPFMFIITMFQSFTAVAIDENDYSDTNDIQLECLSDDTETVEKLTLYKDELLEYMNKEIKEQRLAADDNSYSYLTADDLDFSDSNKIHGLKEHGSYTDYEYNVGYERFMNRLNTNNDYWYIVFQKKDTIYSALLHQTDNPSVSDYNFGGDWYIRSFYAVKTETQGYVYLQYDTEVIKSNISKLLSEKNERSRDIKVVFTDMDYINTNCAVIFVDGTARYMYYSSFSIPYDSLSANTPTKIYESIQKQADKIFFNAVQESTDIQQLYSYNMIMFLLNTCEKYM